MRLSAFASGCNDAHVPSLEPSSTTINSWTNGWASTVLTTSAMVAASL